MKVKILGINKCEIQTSRVKFFQSYDTIVAVRYRYADKIILSKDWQYSTTTAKHVGQWLGMPCKEIQKMIKKGIIKVVPRILEIEILRENYNYAMD